MLAAALTAPALVPAQDSGQPAAQAAAAPRFDVAFVDAKVEQVIASINDSQPIRVSLFGRTTGERVTVLQEQTTLEEALATVTRQKGWIYWRLDDGGYGVADRAYFEQEILPRRFVQKVFQPRNLKASELQKAVQDLLTSGAANGTAVADDRTNKLIVNDMPVVMERIERLLREIDVQLITRVFRIRHADVDDVASKIENYKSGPGTIDVDTKTRQIIVTDLLANVKKMELLIDIVDVGPEIVIYDVNNIGIDGGDLESLQNIIDSIRTEDLLFEVNAKQGVFVLEDVPSVHEKVEQILESFDRPVKQVQIQGEIVQTELVRTFGLGIDRFIYSDDLTSAIADGSVTGIPGVSSDDLAADNLGFQNLDDTFPIFDLTGSTVSGSYLNSNIFLQASAVFSDASTNILLQPNLLVKNQESSRIQVGAETPFLTTFFNDNNTGGSTRSTSQQRITDGLQFEITPSIANSFLIELEITIDNDKAFNAGENEGITLIGKTRQNIETILQIPSGQTRAIGGLITTDQSETHTGLPFISKLPVVGPLFGKRTNNETRKNLMLFITPTIVEDTLPLATGTNGRRGRLISEYQRVPLPENVSPETQQRLDEALERLGTGDGGSAMLSGDPDEEMRMLQVMRQQYDSESGPADLFDGSNYTPTQGKGASSAINTESVPVNTGIPGDAQQGGQSAQPGQRGGPPQGRGRGRGVERQPGNNVPPQATPIPATPQRETRY
ncbi:MAG: secretin N-terminal domain-containing protein [Candidatus Sumerlaeia bacterium]|nr:secretin N-terminal domain-containing protein [Candidatus Sumerlaeia bacterium]